MKKRKILFTWELGKGLGHLMGIKNDIEDLGESYEVYIAARNLSQVRALIANQQVKLLPAPFMLGSAPGHIEDTLSYAHLLGNCGFGDADTLHSLVDAWQTLFDLIDPDVVVYEHSPSAIVASLDYKFLKIHRGTGFTCPPISKPLGVFFPEDMCSSKNNQVEAYEKYILHTVNTVLKRKHLKALTALSDIYAIPDSIEIAASSVFDHFARVPDGKTRYVGVRNPAPATPPKWPQVAGVRIFVYINVFDNITPLLCALKNSKQPTIVYSSSIPRSALQPFECDSLVLADTPVDIASIGESCGFAITNGSFNIGCQLLQAGIPQLIIPLHREQQMFAKRLKTLGCCLAANPLDKDNILLNLHRMANEETFVTNARKFVRSHALMEYIPLQPVK